MVRVSQMAGTQAHGHVIVTPRHTKLRRLPRLVVGKTEEKKALGVQEWSWVDNVHTFLFFRDE